MADSLQVARTVIKEALGSIRDGDVDLKNSCVVCHVIFALANRTNSNESDAADIMTQVLSNDLQLNDEFIDVVEQVHMKSRLHAVEFSNRNRSDKDGYVESFLRNALSELRSDMEVHGGSLTLRRLILNYLSVYLAQTLGVDHHAAMEEMYYLLRKNQELDTYLDAHVVRLMKRLNRER